MSDDDYAADSPFDGLDDYFFWDDAASQGVADDLAEHTIPSPVYLEDPAYEMMGGYSDWEYYSDDYYDDDPDLLKSNALAGSPPASLKFTSGEISACTTQKRSRKRKLANTEEIPTLSLADPGLAEIVRNIGHNITGTTWKTKKAVPEKLYHQGEAKRIAFLMDWRNVFRESQPKSDRRSKGTSKSRAALHDAWANDLGLADMGLMTAIGKHISTEDIGNDYDDDGDEASDSGQGRPFLDRVSGNENGEVLQDEGMNLPMGVLEDDDQDFHASKTKIYRAQSLDQILPPRKRQKHPDSRVRTDVLDPENQSDIELELAERIFSSSKMTKTGSVLSAPVHSIRNSNAITLGGTPEWQANGTQTYGRRRPKKQSMQATEGEPTGPADTKNAISKSAAASMSSKKRKVTTEVAAEFDDSAPAAPAIKRAKRVASDEKGLRNDDGNELTAQLPKPATRGFRARRK